MNENVSNDKLNKLAELHPESNKKIKMDDAGFAEMFSALYIHEVRFCPELNSWLVYNGTVWAKDIKSVNIYGKIMEFNKLLEDYCQIIEDEDKRSFFKKHSSSVGNANKMEKILKLARTILQIPISSLDSNPYLINCINGTYDLSSNTFREHRPSDYITMCTDCKYSDEISLQWTEFINQVCDYDTDKINYLHKALGYSILGKANEECMFILWGSTTRNGKSTLLNTIYHVLGDYSGITPVQLICKAYKNDNANSATPVMASLKGKRFVTTSEPSYNNKLNEETIKLLTGGEKIVCRDLYQKPIAYIPQFTLWMSCNDLPSVSDATVFNSGRLRVVEFTKHFSQDERNINLKSELTSLHNVQGILNWLIDGYRLYTEQGLTMPDSMRIIVHDYQDDNDIMELFLNEECERADSDCSTSSRTIFDKYIEWCERSRLYPMNIITFGRELKKHKEWYINTYKNNKYTMYKGLRLRK